MSSATLAIGTCKERLDALATLVQLVHDDHMTPRITNPVATLSFDGFDVAHAWTPEEIVQYYVDHPDEVQ